jgi:hypothetical protein
MAEHVAAPLVRVEKDDIGTFGHETSFSVYDLVSQLASQIIHPGFFPEIDEQGAGPQRRAVTA